MVEGRFVDYKMDGFCSFSGNLFAFLIYYLEMGNVGSGEVVGNVVYVNCTGDETIVLLLYFPNICWMFLSKKGYMFIPEIFFHLL